VKTISVAIVALLLGLGLGYLIFGRSADTKRHGSGAQADRREKASSAGKTAHASSRPASSRHSEHVNPRRLLAQLRLRHGQLVKENKALRTRLDGALEDLRFAQGTPTPWPHGLPARLKQKPLVAAFTKALRQAGFRGEVTDFDCKEYPCVLGGTLKGEVGSRAFQRVLDARAMRPYSRDHAQTSVTNRSGHDPRGKPFVKSYFAVALLQHSQDGTPQHRRTIHRLRQLLDATTAQ
jgi:hypothetical protein